MITLCIERIVQGGSGLGRQDGKAVFVPCTLPGEEVTAKLTRVRSDYAEGEVREILRPSPERETPRCPLFGVCGGCQLQHASQSAQLHYKVEALRETLLRIGKITIPVDQMAPAVASPLAFHYRGRAQFKVGSNQIGFYRRQSHQIVPVADCPLLTDPLNCALAFLRERLRERLSLQGITEVEIQGNMSEEVLIVLKGRNFSEEAGRRLYEMSREISCCGVVTYTKRGRMVFGQDALIHRIDGRTLRVSDRSFFQVNAQTNRLLIETVRSWVAPESSDAILELYSGVGNFTLPLAERARQVTAMEAHPVAVRDARWNITKAGLKNVTLIPASVEAGLSHLLRKKCRYAAIFLDPPREGMSAAALAALAALAPRRIVYLSCNPATLARDLRTLSQQGYPLHRLAPFEMFPQTAHLEVLAEVRQP